MEQTPSVGKINISREEIFEIMKNLSDRKYKKGEYVDLEMDRAQTLLDDLDEPEWVRHIEELDKELEALKIRKTQGEDVDYEIVDLQNGRDASCDDLNCLYRRREEREKRIYRKS